MGKEITKTDLVPAFQSLLKDCEAEVKLTQIGEWKRHHPLVKRWELRQPTKWKTSAWRWTSLCKNRFYWQPLSRFAFLTFFQRWSWPTFCRAWRSWWQTPISMSSLLLPRWVHLPLNWIVWPWYKLCIMLWFRWSWVWVQSLGKQTQLSTSSLFSSHNWKTNVLRWVRFALKTFLSSKSAEDKFLENVLVFPKLLGFRCDWISSPTSTV